jgi:hypothetical protein
VKYTITERGFFQEPTRVRKGGLFLMGRVRSVYRAIESVEIPTGYDLDLGHLEELVQHTHDQARMIGDAFRFGYLQGQKAAKAAERKAKR